MVNKRIYFAIQGLAIKPEPIGAAVSTWADGDVVHGVQSVAVTTTFNLEQAFELGQLEIYENIEGIPNVEISASKVLDGYPPMFLLATQRASTPTLAGRSNPSCIVGLGVWDDSKENISSGLPQNKEISHMEASGMFVGSVTYNFPLDANFSEDVTFVGNNKIWADAGCDEGDNGVWDTGYFNVPERMAHNADQPFAETGSAGNDQGPAGGVNRRENMRFLTTAAASTTGKVDYTKLPTDIPGVVTNGVKNPECHVQSITVSTDFGREELFELGSRQPYSRVVTFPVEVTTDIEVLSVSGDLVNALADGCGGTAGTCTNVVNNLSNQEIVIAACEGTRISAGTKNKLASVNYGGGDAGGGNVTVTYSYTTFNDFTVMHPLDPAPLWDWSQRVCSGWLGASDTTRI